jgi:hypothetical protein
VTSAVPAQCKEQRKEQSSPGGAQRSRHSAAKLSAHQWSTDLQLFFAYLIAGWSGFFVMAVELLGGRLLAPNFGSSIYVWGAIITIFMLALSVGYLLGGRYSMHAPSVRRLGGILLVAALTVLPMVQWGTEVLDWVSLTIPDPRFGSLSAAAALFFIPTVFSGLISSLSVVLFVGYVCCLVCISGLL